MPSLIPPNRAKVVSFALKMQFAWFRESKRLAPGLAPSWVR